MTASRATIVADTGMVGDENMSGWLTRRAAVLVALAIVWSPALLAQDRAARVTEARGNVSAVSATGAVRGLSEGDDVFARDTIRTERRANVKLRFEDGARFELGPNAAMRVEDFSFADRDDDKLSTRVLQGVFRFVSGLMAKARPRTMSVHLQSTASIGVRGTNVVGQVEGEEATVILVESEEGEPDGEVEVFNEHGTVTIAQAGFGTTVPNAASAPTPPRRMQLNAIQNLMRTLGTIGRIGVPRIR